jgi:hypothetical protein
MHALSGLSDYSLLKICKRFLYNFDKTAFTGMTYELALTIFPHHTRRAASGSGLSATVIATLFFFLVT